MTVTIENESRGQIARFLPDAIARALNSYRMFMERDFKNDPGDFGKHHGACKVAIAHIELLLKLARWADLPDAKAADHNNQIILAAVLQEAEEELQSHLEHDDEADEGEDE